MNEPNYVFIRGQGWVVSPGVIRHHEGKIYSLTGELRPEGSVKQGERIFAGKDVMYALSNAVWFQEWCGTPAGFGGACADTCYNTPIIVITTELIE